MSESENTQTIKIVVDDANAVRQSQAFHDRQRKNDNTTHANAAKKSKTAFKSIQDDIDKTLKKDLDATSKSEKAYLQAVKLKLKSGKALEDAITSKAKKEQSEEERSERAYVQAVKRKLKAEKELEDSVARKAKKERDEIERSERAYVKAKRAEANAIAALAREQEKQTSILDASIGSVTKYVASFAGIGAVVAIGKSLNDYFAQIQRETNEAARDMIKFRDTLKEIAVLTGHPGQTTPALIQNLEVRAKSFQSGPEANEMMTQMWASGAGSIDAGLISKDEMSKTAGTAGQLSKMQNASPAAVGKLWGILPQMTGKKVNTAEDIDILAERLNEEQKLGGFTNFDQYASQMSQTSPYVTKEIYDAPTHTALLSAFARGGQGDTAGQNLEALTSGLGVGMMRNRGMKIDPKYAADYQTTSKYIQTLRDDQGKEFGDHSRPEDVAMAIVKELTGKLEFDKAKGQYVNIDLELQKRGFANEETRKAIEKLAGEEHAGGMVTKLLGMAHAPLPAHAGIISGQFKEHIANDPTGIQAQVDLQEDVAKAKRAMDPAARLMQMDAASFFQLKGRSEITGELKDWQDRSIAGQIKDDAYLVQREGKGVGWYSQVKHRTQNQLGRQLKDLGIDFQVDEANGIGRGGRKVQFGDANYLLTDEQREKAVSMIQAKGGNPLSGGSESTAEVIDLLKQQLAEQKALREKMNAPGPGQPNVPAGGAKPLIAPPPKPGPANRQAGT